MAVTRDMVFTVLGIDRASRTFDKVGRSIDAMARRATAAQTAVAASSAASAAAIGVTVGGLPTVFAAMGAAAVSSNTEVRRSFEDLGEELRTGLAADAAPMADALVDAAGDISTAYRQLSPQLERAFDASADHLEELTGGVLDFAHEAMPGMVTSIERAGPVMSGLRSLMRDTGAGVGDFAEIVSESSDAAGRGLEHLGQLARGVLPEVGGILGDLTGLWAAHGDEVVDVVTRIIGVVGDLGGSALPVLGAGLGVALDVLQGILGVLEPMAPILGPMVGTWIALGTAMKGMRAARGVMESVAGSVNNFAAATDRAASRRGVGKLRAAAGGVLGMLGGPWGVALTAATLGLAVFGQESADAAADQSDLAAALRESNGAFDDQARSAIVNSDAYKQIAGSVETAGLSHGEFVDALIEGGPALDELQRQLQEQATAGRTMIDTGGGVAATYTDQAQAARNLLDGMGPLRGMVSGAVTDFERATEASDSLAGTMYESVPGSDALRESLKTLGSQTAETADRADALNTAWRRLFGIALDLEEAQAAFEGGLDDLAESIRGVQGDTGNWAAALLHANGSINVSTEAGRELSEQLIAQGEDYRALAQSAYDSALQQGKSQAEAAAAAVASAQTRRGEFLREMRQLDLTEDQARALADRYLGMPDDVVTLIRTPGLAVALENLRRFRNAIYSIPLTRTMTLSAIIPGQALMAMQAMRALGMKDGGRVGRFADGGQIGRYPAGGRIRGPGGPRDDLVPILASNGEYVVNAASTQQWLPVLEAINNRRGGPKAALASAGTPMLGSSGGAATQTVRVEIDVTGGDDALMRWLLKAIRVRGGANVVFGGGRS